MPLLWNLMGTARDNGEWNRWRGVSQSTKRHNNPSNVGNITQEFKIGVLVTAGIAMLIFGVSYLQGFNPFKETLRYYAVYEKVDGLSVSNPVLVNGFKVGQVTEIAFSDVGDGSLIVSFDLVQENLRMPKDTRAKITSNDLFGTKSIELIAGKAPVLAEPGDTLVSDIEVGIAEAVRVELMPLKNKTDQLIDGVDDILENLKAVFEADATLGLPSAFEGIERTVRSLESTSTQLDSMVTENRSSLRSIMTNINAISQTIRTHNDDLANVMSNVSQISDSLAAVEFGATMARADRALEDFATIMEKVNQGEGSLGALINTDSLHAGLMQTNAELQYLLNDLYLNPWRYVKVSVFGKKNEKKLSKKELKRLRQLIDEQLDERGVEGQ